jgi:hypothetical protein
VILFCHHPAYCFEPLPVTRERRASIRDWLADATRSDDAAPFAQLKQGIKKANPLRASSVLIFEGEIVRIQPTGTGPCESLKVREHDIKIDHALFGETEKGRIAASLWIGQLPDPAFGPPARQSHCLWRAAVTGKSAASSARGCND